MEQPHLIRASLLSPIIGLPSHLNQEDPFSDGSGALQDGGWGIAGMEGLFLDAPIPTKR